MAKELDVYRDWLGIKDPTRPPNHYQLLRLKPFEDDSAKVRAHYRKMNEHVRKFAAGDFADASQQLLNELARAMLCLTDARRKGEYDASLGRANEGGERRRSMEELLIARKVITSEQLDKARNFANAVGLEIRDALVQQKMASPAVVTQIYAESAGVPYIELGDIGIDETLVPKVPAVMARQHSCAPVMIDDGQLLMASPNLLHPEVEDQLRMRFDMPVRTVLCTAGDINAVIAEHYPKEKAVAEMAGGGAAPAGTEGQAAAASLSPAERKEQKRRRNMIALMGFNFGFMATMIYQVMFQRPTPGFLYSLAVAAVVGAVVGGTAYVVQSLRE